MEQITKQKAVEVLFSNNFKESETLRQHEEITDKIDEIITLIFYQTEQKHTAEWTDALHTLFIFRECLKCREQIEI
jgi:hypothetical protein